MIDPDQDAAAARVPWRLRRATASARGMITGPSLTVLGRGISKFAIVIFLILAARLLSKEQFGVYSYVLVLTQVFAILGDPQVSLIAAREVSAGRHSPATGYWTALPLVLASAVLSALGLVLFGLVDSFPHTTIWLLLIAGTFVVFNRLVGLGTDMLRAIGRFRVEATIETGSTVLLVTIASILAANDAGITAVLAVFAGTAMLTTAVCHLVLRRDIGRPTWTPGDWRPALRSGLKLSVATSSTAIATRCPLLILGSTGSAAAVASYSAGLRCADAFYIVALTAGQALLPAISALASTDPTRALRLTRRTILAALAAGVLLAALCAPFGSAITGAVFGSQYESAGSLLAVMMLAAPFMGMFWLSWFGLIAFGGESDLVKVAITGALLSLLVGVTVISGSDEMAAAWVYAAVIVAMALGSYAMFELRVRGRVAA